VTLLSENQLAGLVLGICLLGGAGCGPKLALPKAGHDAQKEAVQTGVASESIVAQTMDAATQVLVVDAAASWRSSAGSSIPGPAPSVTDTQVSFGSICDPSGRKRFKNTSGTFTVHAEAAVVPSWPLGTTIMATHRLTITFDQGPVAFTDPVSKVTAIITGGTFSSVIETTYALTATGWTLALDSEATVPGATPLQVLIEHPRRRSHTVTLSGARDAHLRLRRERGEGVDRLSSDTTIDGTGSDGVAIAAAVGVDPQRPELSFTDWHLTVDGAHRLVWNRHLHAAAHWDYVASAATRTIDALDEEIFLARDGVVSGPFNAVDLALIYSSSAN
jgi:hypothetical protein